MTTKNVAVLAGLAVAGFWAPSIQAEVVIEWVIVAEPGKADHAHGDGYGGVDYVYRIGKYEITNDQYRGLLNAVAAVGDPNGPYNPEMAGLYGGIARTGSGTLGDPRVYEPKDGDDAWDVSLVNYTGWHDAARFANGMHNGQPNSARDAATTEAEA